MRKSPGRSAAVPFGGGGDTGLGASQALDFGSHLADYSWRKPFSRRSQSLSSCGDGGHDTAVLSYPCGYVSGLCVPDESSSE